tara:strand:- start:255 stop:533 length:279 start_codon:yes stop_codon:yes gene_type:complete
LLDLVKEIIMGKYLLAILVFCYFGCSSTKRDAIEKQRDFIKTHPTWIGHDFEYKKRKPELNVDELIKVINEESEKKSADTIGVSNINKLRND